VRAGAAARCASQSAAGERAGRSGPQVGEGEQISAAAQVTEEKLCDWIGFEIDGGKSLLGQRDDLQVVFAPGSVGELRAAAVAGIG
jgi:hypothetical protein